MNTYDTFATSKPKNPKLGDFYFDPLFGVHYYFNRDNIWRDNLIEEQNGDVFEIVRLEHILAPEDFALV